MNIYQLSQRTFLATLTVSLGLSATTAFAHGAWVFPHSTSEKQTRIAVSFADGPAPGASSMLNQNAKTTVFVVDGNERKELTLTRFTAGDVSILTGVTDVPEIQELEAIYIPPPRPASPAGASGRTNAGSRGTGASSPEASTQDGGRRQRGSSGGTRMGRGGAANEESSASQGGSQSEFYSKYFALSKGEELKSKSNQAMKVDFLPEWDGQSLNLMVFDRGQPAENCEVTITGPDEYNDRAETEVGTVQFRRVLPGRYQAEVRLIEEISASEEHPSPTRITRIGTVVLDLK